MGPYNGSTNPAYDLAFLASACQKGDLDTLDMLINSEDIECKFAGDINTHVTDMTPLMYAVQNGQVEAVELMLKAKADPHMKCRMAFGKDPSDGESAKEIAMKAGWDDIVKVLEQAEKDIKPHKYKRYGRDNNARLQVFKTGETGAGKDCLQAMKRIDYVPGMVKKAPALPRTTVALMFPGQGSQYKGMLSGVKDLPEVQEMAATAKSILGFDLLKYCLEGPEEKLEETSICQPALFIAGMAGLEKLKKTRPEAVERPGAVAGLSLGEYVALCAAGVITFQQGIELVKVRGSAMQRAAELTPQSMVSIAGLEQEAVEKLCAEQAVKGEVCQISNFLFPKGFSCGGTKKAIEKLQKAALNAGAMQSKLVKTSGGFHTKLMEPAKQELEEALEKMLPNMKPPICDIYLNVTGRKVKAGTSPAEFVPMLAQQLVSPVQWAPSVSRMIADGMSEFWEVGPNKQLKAMMKRVDVAMWNSTYNVDV